MSDFRFETNQIREFAAAFFVCELCVICAFKLWFGNAKAAKVCISNFKFQI